MKSLNEDIKTGQFKQVYLLCGEEAYLKKQYKDRLTRAMLPEGDTMNYAYYEGKGIDGAELIDLAETMPFFAERRLIVVENSGFFKSAEPQLADYMKELPETACFLFVEQEVDKRSRMFKVVKAVGRAVELGRQDEKTLLYWIAGHLKREGRQITERSARHLVEQVGTDMENLSREMEKLIAYTMGRTEITGQDIDDICTVQITNQIFDMVEAVARKEQKKALEYYYDLLALKEPPMRILYLLSRQFRLLLEVKELMKTGADKAKIASVAKLHPFVAGKYMQQCRNFTTRELREAMEEAAELEEAVKTGRLGDRMSVEIYILERSRRTAPGGEDKK